MKYCAKYLKATLPAILLAIAVNGYSQYSSVSYYVVAHPDQWQLFMGTNAVKDISYAGTNGTNKKVVMIYTTAGDESCNGAPLNTAYYLARQDGAHHCVEFFADQTGNHDTWNSSNDTITGHRIFRTQYKNVISYHLRLTGGCYNKGYMGQSLAGLHNGEIPEMSAVDSSASYTHWEDLVKTIQTIVAIESAGIDDISVSTADTDQVVNPGEHPDHIHTAHLALDAIRDIPHLKLNLYQEYNIANRPVNLSDNDIATKAALLSQLDFGRTENGQPSEWDALHISYTSRNYFRTITR